ncbi:MAG TPA: hypothetical protein VH370_25845 [Humisphaera sp.]|jgi:hypothetical protein|nr:hypothetical protein [Humisphaera sp.]
MASGIFEKQGNLKPSTMKTVAERRFDDANALKGAAQMTEAQAKTLREALKKEFKAQAEFEPVNGKGRYRFAVTSKRFAKMPQLKRQDEVWKVVDRILSRDASLDVSLILAFAPEDLAAAGK